MLSEIQGLLDVALAIAFALSLLACYVGLQVIAQKAWHLSRDLGGDPPAFPAIGMLGFSEPQFWDYLRRQCRQPGTHELARLMHVAEVLLTMRIVLVMLFIVAFVVHLVLT